MAFIITLDVSKVSSGYWESGHRIDGSADRYIEFTEPAYFIGTQFFYCDNCGSWDLTDITGTLNKFQKMMLKIGGAWGCLMWLFFLASPVILAIIVSPTISFKQQIPLIPLALIFLFIIWCAIYTHRYKLWGKYKFVCNHCGYTVQHYFSDSSRYKEPKYIEHHDPYGTGYRDNSEFEEDWVKKQPFNPFGYTQPGRYACQRDPKKIPN